MLIIVLNFIILILWNIYIVHVILFHCLQIFVIGHNDGALYHIWQPERGNTWSDWEKLGTFASGEKFASLPFIAIDNIGWWEAYGVRNRLCVYCVMWGIMCVCVY